MFAPHRVTALLAGAVMILAHGIGGFHEPRAEGSEAGPEELAIDISVLLDVSEGPVVMHLNHPGEEEAMEPLQSRGGGRWGTRLELPRADWRVIFEDVNTGTLSDEFSLTDLGVDRAFFGAATGSDDSEPLAVRLVLPVLALAAAALILWFAVMWGAGRKTLASGD